MGHLKTNLFIVLLAFVFILQSCSDDMISNDPSNSSIPVNLVSDTVEYTPRIIDLNLVNAWGIAVSPLGRFWISANHTSVSTVYDGNGNTLIPPVSIPGPGGTPGAPTGVIFNETTDFKISGTPSIFIFAGEDGIISAWVSGGSAVIAADRSSSNAVYKGLAMGTVNDSNNLYAVDFHNAKIDVFDKDFNYLSNVQLLDPGIPSGWGPFNIYNIDGKLFVSYAKQKPPENIDDDPGPGRGYIDIFNPDGSLVRRFASEGGPLNSPWGIEDRENGNILIGNFGDGRISIFDANGTFIEQIKDNQGQPRSIEGLWAIDIQQESGHEKLYFTAGPDDEEHGVFGYMELK